MSADFWAGYLSGVVGIIVGNPLDIMKLRRQTQNTAAAAGLPTTIQSSSSSALVKGTAAPILGYGALNALLFVSYNRCEAALNRALSTQGSSSSSGNLWATWLAGAAGGLATWVVSTPTELVKCRAQMSAPPMSSWAIARQIWRADGIRGLYFGGLVTALRDSIGYGFYFWAYELANSCWPAAGEDNGQSSLRQDAPKILLCGGLAGIVTWASVFPLDVVKSRVQTQAWCPQEATTTTPLRADSSSQPHFKRSGAWQVAKDIYREGGFRPFFRGLTICSARAFVVNAVQWAVYEGIMHELGQGRRQRAAALENDSMAI